MFVSYLKTVFLHPLHICGEFELNSVIKPKITIMQPPMKRAKTPTKSFRLKGAFPNTRFSPHGWHRRGIGGKALCRIYSIYPFSQDGSIILEIRHVKSKRINTQYQFALHYEYVDHVLVIIGCSIKAPFLKSEWKGIEIWESFSSCRHPAFTVSFKISIDQEIDQIGCLWLLFKI